MASILESIPLRGRERELSRLARSVHVRAPLLICGPPDAGKTFLVQRFLHSLPAEQRACCVYVPGFMSVHSLLQEIVRHLFCPRAQRVSERAKVAPAVREFERELKGSTSGRLRVLLREELRERRLCLFLDHFPPFSPFLARLVKGLIWKGETSMYLLARGRSRDEIGYAWSIYFAPEYRLELGALPGREAKALLDDCVSRSGLAGLDTPEFRSEVLRRSAGLPGAIVKMCALAADPHYRSGDQVKLRLVHVDYLMRADSSRSLVRSGHGR